MNVDRFGNPHAPNLSYARGEVLRSTEDDFRKLQQAWSLIRERGTRTEQAAEQATKHGDPSNNGLHGALPLWFLARLAARCRHRMFLE